MRRHHRIGSRVRFVTGNTGDVLPYAVVVARHGSGRTAHGAPLYELRREDTGEELATHGSNVYDDSPAVAAWAEALGRYERRDNPDINALVAAYEAVEAERLYR